MANRDDFVISQMKFRPTTTADSYALSPLKNQLFSLPLDEAGVELRQLKLDAPPNAEAELLLSILRDIGNGLEFLPENRRDEILDSPMVKGTNFRSWRFAFTSASTFDSLPGRIPSPEEATSVCRWASRCQESEHEERGWDQEVHHRLLEAILRDPRKNTEAPIDFTARLPSAVDFSLYLAPSHKKAPSPQVLQALCQKTTTFSVNHTKLTSLQLRPIILSIKTEGSGLPLHGAELQMGTWHAAQWSFLHSALLFPRGRTMAQANRALSRLPFIPGVIIHGHRWLLVLSTREGTKTIFWTDRQFGSTQSIMETYQTVAGLRQLIAWAETVYLPWFIDEILAPLGHGRDDGELSTCDGYSYIARGLRTALERRNSI
ncbi:hypothetical protein B0T10DRAFT_534094 [Thelonectria olida]|uniref:PD-(D/E)XK nuclease-like domain-containing protein n=1 Tax=Thelonectria olida TaxID=1576542 RepID=A0A9P8VPH2_9HYPO|nr:hypothetical protein B0T10DRAFT_534094 [Thelonectria olida]